MPAPCRRIFAAKGRPAVNPLIVHVAGIDAGPELRRANGRTPAECLARRFWPGPLTIVLRSTGIIPDMVTAGNDTVAVRAPAGKVALGLIERAGQPIAAPSANRSNRISPTRAEHVLADLDGVIDLVIDSGPTSIGLESTVLDLTLRPAAAPPGPISRARAGSTRSEARGRRAIAARVRRRPLEPRPDDGPLRAADSVISRRSVDELEGIARPREHRRDRVRPASCVCITGDVALSSRWNRRSEPLATLYDVLHRCDSLAVRARSSSSCRPTSRSGGPFATACCGDVVRLEWTAGTDIIARPLERRQSKSRRWESNEGKVRLGRGSGRPRCR